LALLDIRTGAITNLCVDGISARFNRKAGTVQN